MSTVVIRLSSLGDIVLSASITQALAPVTYITDSKYREIVSHFPGVDTVCVPTEDPLPTTANKIVDLHSNWRSFWIRKRIKGPTHAIKRFDWLRRKRVWLKTKDVPPSVMMRYAAAAGVKTRALPWLSRNNVGSSLVICPTAQHRTKIWPMFKYIEIAQKWSGGVIVLGGPSERLFINQMVDAIGPKARGISELGFTQTILAMNDAKVAIGNDSGLTHLCRAFGIPTLVIMGPTTAQDGFWPHASSTAALPLYCRPCSRHGGPECPIGDHYCMENLTVSDVWQKLVALQP
ncbi:MAG: glycosyltransferase family 9 protein [Myxococcota bacterium]